MGRLTQLNHLLFPSLRGFLTLACCTLLFAGWRVLAPVNASSPQKEIPSSPKSLNHQYMLPSQTQFVYIHGFGGENDKPAFCDVFAESLEACGVEATLHNYVWDSAEVRPLKAGSSWKKSQQNADAESPKFRSEIFETLEAEEKPYVICAFSVGTREVLGALENIETPLKHLQAIYFMGSALSSDSTLKNRKALSNDFRIVNYHSPKRDLVHSIAFNFMSELPAGGKTGFQDETLFLNLPVSCTHAHKGIGVHIDYSILAQAIVQMELWRAGYRLPGKTNINWENEVGEGDYFWNQVWQSQALVEGKQEQLSFEQFTLRPGSYRVVLESDNDASNERRRLARSRSLHTLFKRYSVELSLSSPHNSVEI